MTEIKSVLEERGKTYGKFVNNAAVAQSIKLSIRSCTNFHRLEPDMQEALDMMASKMSRILTGSQHHIDNWIDAAGYPTLVANRLQENEESKTD